MSALTGPARAALVCGMALVLGECETDNSSPRSPDAPAVVTVDTLVRFQVMTGWEAVAQAGQDKPGFEGWRDSLFSYAVNDLGINRLRLGVRSGSENGYDYYARALAGQSSDERCERYLNVNDNENPRVLNPAGFHFSELDSAVVKVALPMKKLLEARGERLFVNLNYVAFLSQCSAPPAYVDADLEEYAEFMLAAFLHLRKAYGLVPDVVEVILEPDKSRGRWSGTLIGRAIVATAARLSAEGFHPSYVAPSTSDVGEAAQFIDEMYSVPGVQPLLHELAYHRYAGVSDANLRALAKRAAAHGTRTAMLEHIGSGVDDLYEDLVVGQASAWQQFTLGVGVGDGGGQYYQILDGRPVMASRTRFLRQYFRYVRMGAQRLGAQSSTSDVRVVAFKNPARGLVVVLHTDHGRPVELRGLRPGNYGVSVTTSSQTSAELGDHAVGAAGTLTFTALAAGVATAYAK
jgi:hypothetical protein